MDTKKVIVAGATGMLGSQIVKELLEQGAEVTAMVRASIHKDRKNFSENCPLLKKV